MHQRFIQSRRQYIVERLCQSILLVVVLLLMNALLGGGTYQINSAVMYLPIFMMVVITLWLVVQSWPSQSHRTSINLERQRAVLY